MLYWIDMECSGFGELDWSPLLAVRWAVSRAWIGSLSINVVDGRPPIIIIQNLVTWHRSLSPYRLGLKMALGLCLGSFTLCHTVADCVKQCHTVSHGVTLCNTMSSVVSSPGLCLTWVHQAPAALGNWWRAVHTIVSQKAMVQWSNQIDRPKGALVPALPSTQTATLSRCSVENQLSWFGKHRQKLLSGKNLVKSKCQALTTKLDSIFF